MPHLSPVPPLPPLRPLPAQEPERRSPEVDSGLAELLQRVFDESETEVQRRLEAVKRRRDFHLVQGGKLESHHRETLPRPARLLEGNNGRLGA